MAKKGMHQSVITHTEMERLEFILNIVSMF